MNKLFPSSAKKVPKPFNLSEILSHVINKFRDESLIFNVERVLIYFRCLFFKFYYETFHKIATHVNLKIIYQEMFLHLSRQKIIV